MKKEHVNILSKKHKPKALHDLAADQLRRWQFIALAARDALEMGRLNVTCRQSTVEHAIDRLNQIINEPPFAVKGKYAEGLGEHA